MPNVTLSPAAARTLIARGYQRVSHDKSGRMASTDAQHRDHAVAADERGWQLGDPYVESGAMSASRYSRKIREGFAGLIADLAGGRFGADILILWEASRASRQSGEWLPLMKALESAGVLLFICADERLYDLAVPRDRKSLRDSASDSEYESDKTSIRVRRGNRDVMGRGNPHGRVLRGYVRRYRIADSTPLADGEYTLNSDKNKIARQVEDPEVGPVIRLIFACVKAGDSLRNIDRALRGEGSKTGGKFGMSARLAAAADLYAGSEAPGGPWSPTGIRDLVTNPTYAGRRRHDPAYRGAHQPAVVLAELPRGNWPALVSDEDWTAVAAIVRNPGRLAAPTRSRQPKHLVSTIATCAKCGSDMTCRVRNGRMVYQCRLHGCTIATAAEVDALVTDEAIGILSDASVYARLQPAPDGTDLALARLSRDEAQRELDDLTAALIGGRISAVMAGAAEAGITARRSAAAARVAELEAPAGLDVLGLAPGADIAARWNAAPLAAQRAVLRVLFAAITVRPTGRGVTVPTDERIEFTRR